MCMRARTGDVEFHRVGIEARSTSGSFPLVNRLGESGFLHVDDAYYEDPYITVYVAAMYVRMFACTNIFMYLCLHMCRRVWDVCVRLYVCIYVRLYVCMYVCMYVCTYVCAYSI